MEWTLYDKRKASNEIEEGVEFWGYEEDGQLQGVMGLQLVDDVTLIRHAYVRTVKRNLGIGVNYYCISKL